MRFKRPCAIKIIGARKPPKNFQWFPQTSTPPLRNCSATMGTSWMGFRLKDKKHAKSLSTTSRIKTWASHSWHLLWPQTQTLQLMGQAVLRTTSQLTQALSGFKWRYQMPTLCTMSRVLLSRREVMQQVRTSSLNSNLAIRGSSILRMVIIKMICQKGSNGLIMIRVMPSKQVKS